MKRVGFLQVPERAKPDYCEESGTMVDPQLRGQQEQCLRCDRFLTVNRYGRLPTHARKAQAHYGEGKEKKA